jgi:hypothetical protein
MKIDKVMDITFLSDKLVQKGIAGMDSIIFRGFVFFSDNVKNKIFKNISFAARKIIEDDLLDYKSKEPNIGEVRDYCKTFVEIFNDNVKDEKYQMYENIQADVSFLEKKLGETTDKGEQKEIIEEMNILNSHIEWEKLLAKIFDK